MLSSHFFSQVSNFVTYTFFKSHTGDKLCICRVGLLLYKKMGMGLGKDHYIEVQSSAFWVFWLSFFIVCGPILGGFEGYLWGTVNCVWPFIDNLEMLNVQCFLWCNIEWRQTLNDLMQWMHFILMKKESRKTHNAVDCIVIECSFPSELSQEILLVLMIKGQHDQYRAYLQCEN